MDGEEVDTMMMGWWKRKKKGNEQMEHSVDPPFSARLTGGLVARFVSGVLGFQVASFASPLASPMGCFDGALQTRS